MSKGFSLLEFSAIVVCAGMAFNEANTSGDFKLASLTSNLYSMQSQSSGYVDSTRYLDQVTYELKKINGEI